MKRITKKDIFIFLLGAILFGTTGVIAATLLASDITYDNTNSSLNANNVQDAIDALYDKASLQNDNNDNLADAIFDILCPGCVYAFPTEEWYFSSKTLTNSDYKTNYKDLIAQTGKNYFIGIILNGNKMSREFACGFVDEIPYCIEGMQSGNSTLNTNNLKLLETKHLFGNTCSISNSAAQHYVCSKTNSYAETNIYGYAISGNNGYDKCMVRNNYGFVICT